MNPVAGEVCYENIGPRERQKRARFGYLALGAAMVAAVALLALGAPWWARLVVGPLFGSAAASWLQARERT